MNPSMRPLVHHPLVRAVPISERAHVIEVAAATEATLARARRLADLEPVPAFCRTIELAMREVRVVAARYWSRDVERWRSEVLRELGGLLFVHAGGEVELEITVVDRELRLAKRDGRA